MMFIFKNSKLNTSRTVLANCTALCGLHKTTYAALIEKEHNIYTCVHAYTSRQSLRKFYKNSMMILFNKLRTAKVGAISKAQNLKGGPFELCETPAGCKKFLKN